MMGDLNQIWLSDYEATAQLGQELMEQIHERNTTQKGTSTHAKLSAQIRARMRQFSTDLNSLRQELHRPSRGHGMTQRESERRVQMLDQLVVKERHIEAAFKNENTAAEFSQGRSTLFDEGLGSGYGRNPFDTIAPDDVEDMSFGDIRTQQQTIISEQDRGLDALSQVLGRQKLMAIDIGNEVDSQNDLIDDIHDHVDRTDHRLIQETRHVKVIDRKSNTCWMLVTVVLIFIAIVVILVVPYNGKF